MKKATFLIPALIIMIITFQIGCAQTKLCPADNPKAKKVLLEYLAQEKNIKDLRDDYNMTISFNAKNNLKSLSGEKYKEECQQLRTHLEWLEDQRNYSIYKLASHYFIVLYSIDQKGQFHFNSIGIVSSEYEALGGIIDFGGSK